ncbi:MAG: hypothetical protein RIR70_1572 [Pseudomonadota bacterium]|jgi:flagellar protein FlaG
MNPLSASSVSTNVVQTAGTLPERPAAPVVEVPAVGAGVKSGNEGRPAPEANREMVEVAAKQIDSFVKNMGRSLSFSVDDTTGRSVVRVVDPETKEVIRQLPPEETLKIAKSLEFVSSVLVQQKA